MSMDKIVEVLQGVALLALVANDLLLQRDIRKMKKEIQDYRVEMMAEAIRRIMEPSYKGEHKTDEENP